MPEPDARPPVARGHWGDGLDTDDLLVRAEAIVNRRPGTQPPGQGARASGTIDLTERNDMDHDGANPTTGAAEGVPVEDEPAQVATGTAGTVPAVPPARKLLAAVLIPLGVLLVAFTAYHRWGGSLTEERAQRTLRAELDVGLDRARAVAAVGNATETVGPGKPVALLRLPALGVEKVVLQGTTSRVLQHGPGHHRASAGLGHEGNAVVVGRRTTYGGPFAGIARLRPGADIEVLTGEGRFVYKVVRKGRVAAGDDAVIAQPAGKAVLTLLTGSGAGAGWYALSAELQDDPLPGAPPSVGAIGKAELSLTGDSTAWFPLLLWGQVLALALVARHRMAKRWRPGSIWLLTTPVVVVAAMLVFEAGDGLLPPVL